MIGNAKQHIGHLIEQRLDSLADSVISQIKELGPEHRTSGDDSGLDNVWEEFKYQVQIEHSVVWDAYEDTIQGFCGYSVKELSWFEFRVLWYATDGYVQWNEERETETPYHSGDLESELYRRVTAVAMNETLESEVN